MHPPPGNLERCHPLRWVLNADFILNVRGFWV